MTKKPKKDFVLHERYDRNKPLLRELVSVSVFYGDGLIFDILLTRVPSIGECVQRQGVVYKITYVEHSSVDNDGRAEFGSHAYVHAEEIPDTYVPRRKKKKRNQNTRG